MLVSKLLEPRRDHLKTISNSWRKHLESIVPVKIPTTMEQALSPEYLTFANERLMEGKQLVEIMKLMGLTGADPKWRAIRKALIAQALPENESDALLKAYEEQEELFSKMEELLCEVDAKLDETPRTEEELKAHHNYYKYKLDIIKQMVDMRGHRFSQFMEVKRLAKGSSGNLAVQIVIQNNVPRPKKIDAIEAKVVKK